MVHWHTRVSLHCLQRWSVSRRKICGQTSLDTPKTCQKLTLWFFGEISPQKCSSKLFEQHSRYSASKVLPSIYSVLILYFLVLVTFLPIHQIRLYLLVLCTENYFLNFSTVMASLSIAKQYYRDVPMLSATTYYIFVNS